MVWERTKVEEREVKAVAEFDGETRDFTFESSDLLRDAIEEIADELEFSSMSVYDANGDELLMADGGKTMGTVGNIKVVKKMQGNC